MKKCLYVITVLCMLSLAQIAWTYTYDITTEASRHSVPMNAEVMVTVSVSWPQEDNVDHMVRAITPPESDAFELIHATQSSRSVYYDGGPQEVKTFYYRYRARVAGVAEFDPFSVELVRDEEDIELLKGEPLSVTVVPSWQYYGIWAIYFVAGVLVCIALGFGLRAVLAQRRVRYIRKHAEQYESEERERLKALRDQVLSLKHTHAAGEEGSYLKAVRQILEACPESEECAALMTDVERELEDVAYAGVRPDEAKRSILIRKIERFVNRLVVEEDI